MESNNRSAASATAGRGGELTSYLHVVRLRFLAALAYRFEVVARLGTNAVLMVAAVFLWRTAFRGAGAAAGVGERQMVTYAVVSVLLSSLFAQEVQQTLHERIRRGDIAIDLIRPVKPLAFWFAADLGAAASSLLLQGPPLLALAMAFEPFGPADASAGVLFLASTGLSFVILWLLAALSGLAAFWTLDLGNLGYLKDALVRLLSGSVVPIWFFPEWFQSVSQYLPFVHTYQLPLAIFIGRTHGPEAVEGMLVQGVWIAILGGVVAGVWSRGRRRVLIQGG